MAKADKTQLVSIGNGLYARTRKQLPTSIFKVPQTKIDRTEYCEQCRNWHERPTWPTPHPYRREAL